MAITSSRLQEIIAQYNKLKAKVEDVDRKYAMDYQEPQLDMPESLNLTKLVYVPKTEAELTEEANRQIEPTYLSKQRQLDSSYAKSLQNINKQYSSLEEDTRAKLIKLLAEYNKACDDLFTRLVDNGLLFSGVMTRANNQARDDYNNAVEQLNESEERKREQIDADKESADRIYSESCASLEREKDAKFADVYGKLIEEEEKEKQSVHKYNVGLDEKETKYQATRARAYESARQTEYNRAYAAAKLYAQLGASGYAERIQWEKYRLFQHDFAVLTKEEANALLNIDSFARSHLQDYYSTLVDWINRNLQ